MSMEIIDRMVPRPSPAQHWLINDPNYMLSLVRARAMWPRLENAGFHMASAYSDGYQVPGYYGYMLAPMRTEQGRPPGAVLLLYRHKAGPTNLLTHAQLIERCNALAEVEPYLTVWKVSFLREDWTLRRSDVPALLLYADIEG